MYRIDNWINEGSRWVVDLINSEYLNISVYAPLLGSNFIELPNELSHPKKGLINTRNNDNKCFLWCHVRHLNPVNSHATRITEEDRRIADTLDYSDVTFPVSERDYGKIEDKNSICINVFSYEGKVYPIYVSKKTFNGCLNLLMIHSGNRSHYVYIKDFNRLMFNKNGHKNEKWFCMRCLQCFSSENILNKHKKYRLMINREQRVKLSEGTISFKNYLRQMKVPFKIYADFECILRECRVSREVLDENSSWTNKYQGYVPCGFSYKVVCIDDRFIKDIVIYRGTDCVNKFISAILDEYEYCKNAMKNYFNENLIMSVKEKERFQLSNNCWVCGKLFDLIDEKVRSLSYNW